jgi:hypothetical protein
MRVTTGLENGWFARMSACRGWHDDVAMGDLELTRAPRDRRLYVLADIGSVRLKGWASRAASAEADGRR